MLLFATFKTAMKYIPQAKFDLLLYALTLWVATWRQVPLSFGSQSTMIAISSLSRFPCIEAFKGNVHSSSMGLGKRFPASPNWVWEGVVSCSGDKLCWGHGFPGSLPQYLSSALPMSSLQLHLDFVAVANWLTWLSSYLVVSLPVLPGDWLWKCDPCSSIDLLRAWRDCCWGGEAVAFAHIMLMPALSSQLTICLLWRCQCSTSWNGDAHLLLCVGVYSLR